MLKSESERLPVDTSAFWKGRIYNTVATGKELHTIIYNTDYEDWRRIHNETSELLKQHIRAGEKLLDAGCAYGPLFDCFQRPEDYWGIDISPDLIEIGRIRHPNIRLEVGDLRHLSQFADKFFDFVVCRSVEDMIKENLSDSLWEEMSTELKRVGKKLLLMEYTNPVTCKVVEC